MRLWIRGFGYASVTAGVLLGFQVATFAGVSESNGRNLSSSEAKSSIASSGLELHVSINEAVAAGG